MTRHFQPPKRLGDSVSRFRNHPPSFVITSVRLVSETRSGESLTSAGNGRGSRLLRPLFAGLAILHRDARAGATWTIDVSEDGRLLPHAPRSAGQFHQIVGLHRALGRTCRVGAALAVPADLAASADLAAPADLAVPADRAAGPVRRPRAAALDNASSGRRPEIYGWSLMYQLPGMRGTATIDPHEHFDDLPAFFESPLELIDRSTFLAARGIANRPIALLTRPEDFVRCETDGRWGNRFYPLARFRRPCRLDAVL
jgi:hypothetical protein